MGSTETILRNQELLEMQYKAQRQWALDAVATARDGVAHFTKVAESYKADSLEAFKAREALRRSSAKSSLLPSGLLTRPRGS
jgi:hypothetical protein